MNTCDTCKFWKERKKDYTHHEASPFGVCLKGVGQVSQYPDIDGCIGDGRDEDGTGEGRTGPKFGCIHHEPK